MDKSQYRIAQVHANITPLGDTTDTTTVTTTTTDATAGAGGAGGTDTNTTTTDTTVTDGNGTDTTTTTDKPTEPNKPIIVLMDSPFSKKESDKKEMVTPGDLFYYGALTAIIIALLAAAYNSVKTANVAKA